jgi:ribosomal protein S18 acetylase RimI-like enzyme
MPTSDGELKFVKGAPEHVAAIMGWFPDRRSCLVWGGPRFRFPFTPATFAQDARADSLPTYVLASAAGEVLAFGQYYLRADRCHLARLAVAPSRRGEGFGRTLVARLAAIGVQDLGVSECSLFVLADNLPAVRLYEKLGFVRTAYPGPAEADLVGVDYMIAANERLQAMGA